MVKVNDFSNINTDEIFDQFFNELNINNTNIKGGDAECGEGK